MKTIKRLSFRGALSVLLTSEQEFDIWLLAASVIRAYPDFHIFRNNMRISIKKKRRRWSLNFGSDGYRCHASFWSTMPIKNVHISMLSTSLSRHFILILRDFGKSLKWWHSRRYKSTTWVIWLVCFIHRYGAVKLYLILCELENCRCWDENLPISIWLERERDIQPKLSKFQDISMSPWRGYIWNADTHLSANQGSLIFVFWRNKMHVNLNKIEMWDRKFVFLCGNF